ncbi:U11/U12 small nuclear ribonucleoprotein 48 kDa protein [Larimichthys crocea]|uniref:Uncharacterized protein n=1 Tax=Larimichthys crocea TaxID=215358 RepID=A0ACD3QXH0_LARCR|nr:U11/U12 small nuclear ribonucleoprotein 48 kDa protein [Larimichthys crocea]
MADSLPTTSVQDRLQRLQELTEFTENCKKRLDDVFETLGWSWDYNKEMMEQCPFDPDHRVPARSMDRHKASCSLRKMGYSAEEQAEMFDPSVCYENSSVRSFTMGQYSGQPVDVPQTHKRALCDLTVADRLALYDHVVGVLSQQKDAASASNDDLYVDLVSKLQKEVLHRGTSERRFLTHNPFLYLLQTDHLCSSCRRHRSRERSQDRDRESKKKRKKKDRDSRSPDDHHHDRKKKKKKKRDEREKEK